MKPSIKTLIQLTPIALAAILALFPLSGPTVERFYARWLYPALQANLTALSNRAAVPLFDLTLLIVVALLIGGWIYWLRRIRRERWLKPIGRGVLATLAGAAVVYLWFLAALGFNYARPALESVIAFDESRVNRAIRFSLTCPPASASATCAVKTYVTSYAGMSLQT